MVQIPDYLREIAKISKVKNETLSMNIKCTCGFDNSMILMNVKRKNILTKEEELLINESDRWYRRNYYPVIEFPFCAALYDYQKEKYHEIIIYDCREVIDKFDKERDKKSIKHYYKVPYGQSPLRIKERNQMDPFDDTLIITCKCGKCGKQFILFDNRIHGNDAADFDNAKFIDYEFKEKILIKNPGKFYQLSVSIKNYWNFDDVDTNRNPGLIVDDYSNMFSYIKIKATDESKKNYTVFSEELG